MLPLLRRLTFVTALLGIAGCSLAPSEDSSATINSNGFALSFGSGALTMAVGESARLQVAPADGNGQPFTGLFMIKWASSAASSVSVTQDAVLSALANGTATITATATRLDTGATVTASIVVTVGASTPPPTTPPPTTPPPTTPPATPGLAVAYGFSQGSGTSLNDDSGNGVTGTFLGGPTWSAGKNGGGISFNGGGAYVAAGDVNALDGLNRITVSAWIKTTATGEKHIVDKSACDGATNGGPFEFGSSFFTAGKATLLLYKANASPSFVYAESTVTVTDGAWHNVAGVYDGANVLVYVDGALSGSTPAAGLVMPATSNALELGGHCNGNAYPWNGSADDVRVYKRALTSTEVASNMSTPVAAGATAPPPTGGGGSGGKKTYSLDFASALIENPLSAGGIWTNNTQGTGGNVAPGNMTSMRVGLASDSLTRIAFATHTGVEYDDSFAFVPGFAGDQYIEGVIYKEPGYNPNASGSNHEIELILGCSSASGSRIWNEFLVNAGGGVDIVYLNGGPNDFKSIGNVGFGTNAIPANGDVIRATRVGNVLTLYLNGAPWIGYNGSDPSKVAKGSGIGVAAFIRPGATQNKFGFRRVTMGSL